MPRLSFRPSTWFGGRKGEGGGREISVKSGSAGAAESGLGIQDFKKKKRASMRRQGRSMAYSE